MDPGSQEEFSRKPCAGDEALRQEVERLPAGAPKAKKFLTAPAIEAVAKALAQEQAEDPHPDLIGCTLLHYQVLEKIGQSGMGVVFKAEDLQLKRTVALKFLPESMEPDEVARMRCLREARSAAALDHPYICSIHEVSEVDSRDFIVMEYVEGQTLMEWAL